MKVDNDLFINVSHEVTKADGTNDGIWYFGDRLKIEDELIIGFSPTNYHCFIICGKEEFHPRFSINPCKLQPSRIDNIRAAVFIRIKNVPKEDLLKLQNYLVSLKNKRTPTCHQGLLQVLEKGIGIKIPRHSILGTTPRSLIKGFVKKGLVDKNNNTLPLEFYTTRTKPFTRVYFDISIITWRFAWVFFLSNLHFKLLRHFKPQILAVK